MAIITKCSECHREVTASLSDHWPLFCDTCRRKHGWKPWEEMTLEEKVENLNRRLGNTESRNALIG
jgi:hypothetical protein